MKKLIVIVVVLAFATTLLYLAVSNTPKQTAKAITVSKDYSYVYDTDQYLNVDLYLNEVDQPLMYIESYEKVAIKSMDDSRKLSVKLKTIEFVRNESYLGEQYLLYKLSLEVPILGNNFEIEDAYLEVELQNDQNYTFRLGRISLFYERGSEGTLTFLKLSSLKDKDVLISRIKTLTILLNETTHHIESIKINLYTNVTYQVSHDVLTIEIPYEAYLLNEFSVVIHYNQGQTLEIKNYPFVIDYHVLETSGTMVHVYATH